MKHALLIIALLLVFALPISAQDDDFCTVESYQSALQEIAQTIMEFSLEIDGDTTGLEVALALEVAADTLRGACYQLEYVAEDYPGGLIGPVAFGGELYRAQFISDSFNSLTITPVEGDCDEFNLITIGDMDGGQDDTIYEFENCVAIFEITNTTSEWTFTVERLR